MPDQEGTVSSGSTRNNSLGGTEGLPWSGVLTDDEISRLKQEFGHVLICPGYTGHSGNKSDAWGKIYVPGAAVGMKVARRRLKGWAAKNNDERFNWWPTVVQEKGVEPVTIQDLLSGTTATRWMTYRQASRKAASRMSEARFAQKRRKDAVHRANSSAPAEAASALVGFKTSP
ncbi:unnamed protein product [Sympodiomycopsis kandeliae]